MSAFKSGHFLQSVLPSMAAGLWLVAAVLLPRWAAGEEARLLRNPAVSKTQVAFVYANDIWVAEIGGGAARRLTSANGAETEPHFSPDGTLIAFSGEYDGNTDVYVVPAAGGEPKRLTWHPADDEVRGWTNDGQQVIFASGRTSVPIDYPKFWQVSVQGGMPEPLPIPRIEEGKFSSDGSRMAYQEIRHSDQEWRNYRGGQNGPIRIIDLHTLQTEKLPWDGANDNTPVWLDNTIYFLSDRNFTMNVWSCGLTGKVPRQVTFFAEFDCKHLEAGGGRLIFENGGYLYLFDPAIGKPEKLNIELHGDFPDARPHWKSVGWQIAGYALSPTGKRAAFEARGDIFTVPAKQGEARNLTASSGVADRSPAWSPDGERISWFSDEGGEYQLVIADQFGAHRKKIALEHPTFFYTPVWSPDSKRISFGDADRNLWVLNLKTQKAYLIDNEGFAVPRRTIAPAWSPDSKWIAYAKRLPNQYRAIFIYSIDQKKSFQLTDGMSDCASPAWDAGGKYLYFLASTDLGLNVGWLDLSSIDRPVNSAIYLAVLSADEPSPFLPQSDEENADKEKKDNDLKTAKKDEGSDSSESAAAKNNDDKKKKAVKVKIDFEGIGRRIVALNVPVKDYVSLAPGKEGTMFYLERKKESGMTLRRFLLKDQEQKEILSNPMRLQYALSADGEKLLYSAGWGDWAIADANGTITSGEGRINTQNMLAKIDPPAEWRQMFKEALRYQRDYFYVDNVHGLDLDWVYRTYAPWVEHVRHRADLTYILDVLGGETSVGHSFAGGGDMPYAQHIPVGLLGADLSMDHGRCRIAKIYAGENWNPDLRAPLSGPGIDVHEGDYLLAVNGKQLDSSMNPYSLFEQTTGKQTVLTVNAKPSMHDAREVTVVPVYSELALRRKNWIEENRRTVDKLSGGKLAYVWLPDTGYGGYEDFNRYYFAQQDKKGAVIDERFNGGGAAADYIVDLLSRSLMGYFNNPIGNRQPFTEPDAGIWGPKAMIINESAGSGGDLLPYMFRQKGIGPLVGTRTWGGLVGIWEIPPLLMDGGGITAPRGGFYNLHGEWDVENKGVAPDIVVEQEPAAVVQGHDPQLEKAVEVVLELLKKNEVKLLPQPPDPIRAKRAKGSALNSAPQQDKAQEPLPQKRR